MDSYSLKEDQIKKCLDTFAIYSDRNGVASTKKLGHIVRHIGENPTESELQEMVDHIDPDGTRTFRLPEFLLMIAKKFSELSVEDDIQKAFRLFDRNGTGNVDRYELRLVLQNLGEKLTDEEVDLLMNEVDVDINGQINYEEFSKSFLN